MFGSFRIVSEQLAPVYVWRAEMHGGVFLPIRAAMMLFTPSGAVLMILRIPPSGISVLETARE